MNATLAPPPAVGLAAPYLEIAGVRKTFGRFVALDDIALTVARGEFVCFLGPSGCGKTTLLRIIAGLEEQTSGRIIQDGVDISHLPPARRTFGIVFQSYALFPNLTVAQNVAYGLENRRLPRSQVQARVQELLALVGLKALDGRYAAQLSGGQQQRVALARALALAPGLLLLDEPLSALDARVRATLRGEILRLHRRLGVTTIMVTHDQAEALTMADRIVVMDQGHIVQVGPPHAIYTAPSTPFVAQFVGEMNFIPATVSGGSPPQVRWGATVLPIQDGLDGAVPGTPITLAIRPEEVRVLDEQEAGAPHLAARVERAEFLGAFYRLHLQVPADSPDTPPLTLRADLPASAARQRALSQDSRILIQLPPQALRVYPARPGPDEIAETRDAV